MIEEKIQGIVQFLFRTIGPLILRGGLGGGAGSSGGPTTTSSFDDDFEDSDEDTGSSSSSGSGSSSNGRKVAVSLPTFPPFEDSEEDTKPVSAASTATSSFDDTDSPSRVNLDLNAAGSETESKTDDSNSVRRR